MTVTHLAESDARPTLPRTRATTETDRRAEPEGVLAATVHATVDAGPPTPLMWTFATTNASGSRSCMTTYATSLAAAQTLAEMNLEGGMLGELMFFGSPRPRLWKW